MQVQEHLCFIFYPLACEALLCKHPIAAHTISDPEHETALQILRAVIGLSSVSVSLYKNVY